MLTSGPESTGSMTTVPDPALFRLRSITPRDRAGLTRFYAGLSPDSRAARFHGATRTIPAATATFFCGSDHEHREGIVAECFAGSGDPVIVGHVCIEPIHDHLAEVAIAAPMHAASGQGRACRSPARSPARHDRPSPRPCNAATHYVRLPRSMAIRSVRPSVGAQRRPLTCGSPRPAARGRLHTAKRRDQVDRALVSDDASGDHHGSVGESQSLGHAASRNRSAAPRPREPTTTSADRPATRRSPSPPGVRSAVTSGR
jgi:hypothetical protein